METKNVLDRENIPTNELEKEVTKEFKGFHLTYKEVFYLDYEVNEDTGMIHKTKKVKHYTKNQVSRNMKALKSAYLVAKGAADPNEIKQFRKKYDIAASTLSLILGFSKNTISNIENEGVASLPSGRLIKVCINNKDIIDTYIQVCDVIDDRKKEELSQKLSLSQV